MRDNGVRFMRTLWSVLRGTQWIGFETLPRAVAALPREPAHIIFWTMGNP
ncbi:hypothetical protein LMG28614_03430 [Paraburkholderia ultramafica]|uniref:Uncharacterized protein n=1 Tax=Paraburkholderia ultramafica TaxID=1544867 RepID=A0A6S7BQ34_9BURK|nr:hypothetical protein LMG28614_03430 [Paraburkholderia ultramafica]